jgi:hypothetical protein
MCCVRDLSLAGSYINFIYINNTTGALAATITLVLVSGVGTKSDDFFQSGESVADFGLEDQDVGEYLVHPTGCPLIHHPPFDHR